MISKLEWCQIVLWWKTSGDVPAAWLNVGKHRSHRRWAGLCAYSTLHWYCVVHFCWCLLFHIHFFDTFFIAGFTIFLVTTCKEPPFSINALARLTFGPLSSCLCQWGQSHYSYTWTVKQNKSSSGQIVPFIVLWHGHILTNLETNRTRSVSALPKIKKKFICFRENIIMLYITNFPCGEMSPYSM